MLWEELHKEVVLHVHITPLCSLLHTRLKDIFTVHVFAGRMKIVSQSSSRTSAVLKYFCPLLNAFNSDYSNSNTLLALNKM